MSARVVVLGIGDGSLQHLLEQMRAPFFGMKDSDLASALPTGTCRGRRQPPGGTSAARCARTCAMIAVTCMTASPRCSKRRPWPCLSPEWPLKVRGRGKLAELVANHVLGHQHRNVVASVMNGEREADHFGRIIERRDQVLIGRRLLVCTACRILAARWASTKGPFLTERGTCQASKRRAAERLLLATIPDDHPVRTLVVAGLVALRGLAPRGYRMAAARGLALAATVRVIDRVHRDTAHGRADAAPALRTGLAVHFRRLCSSLPTSPIVARHSTCTLRISPERRRIVGVGMPSRATICTPLPAAARKLGALAGLQLHRNARRTDRQCCATASHCRP
jgi:hypothetical protein